MHRTGQSGAPRGPVEVSAPRHSGDGRRGFPRCVRASLTILAVLVLAALSAAPASAAGLSHSDRSALQHYAADTWHSFDLLVDAHTGLPADNVDADGTALGLHLADEHRRLPVEHAGRARDRPHRPPRGHRADGAHAGDARAHAARTERPVLQLVRPGHRRAPDHLAAPTARPSSPSCPSVDNGWLAAALVMVEHGVPELRAQAQALEPAMDFGFYYDPRPGPAARRRVDRAAPGLQRPAGRRVVDVQRLRRPELRAAHRQLPGHRRGPGPGEHYFRLARTFSPECGVGDFQEMQPSGVTRTYLGVDVYEGHYDYRGMHIVPTWGGDMFEALMPTLFVPEERWGAALVGRQPPAVRARADRARPRRGALRLLGLLAQRQPVGRLQRLRRRRDRDAGRRLPLQQRQHVRRPRLRRLPPRQARPAALRLHQRRRHAARLVPGPALRAARGAREPRTAALALRASTARAASTTPSTSSPARWPAPTWRWTRGWSWPRRPTR